MSSSNQKVVICCREGQQPPYNTMLRFHNWGKELVKRGYDVTIIASSVVHNTDIDVIDVLGKDQTICDGINYLYIKTPKYQGNGLGRFKNMAKYVLKLKKQKTRIEKPDIIIAADAYVFPFAKKINKNAKVISDITDLWPLSIIEYANLSKFNPIVQMFYYFEKKAYIKSDALIFSMEGGKDYVEERKYAKKVNHNKIFHINMGCDISQIDEYRKNETPLDWDMNLFNIGYCGSIRQANNVKQICDAALTIKKNNINDVFFRIYGNGDELESLIKYCKDNEIDNVKFYGRIEKEKIPSILSKSNANILTYKQVNLMKYGGSQSKLFDYLSVGVPIICNCNFGYNLITRYNCGVVTKSQSTDDFIEAVMVLKSLPKEKLEGYGKNARKTAELYDVKKLTDQLVGVFDYLSR